MSMLAELVELVIGVDTHADTHTAALVVADTRALLATVTVSRRSRRLHPAAGAGRESRRAAGSGRSRAPAATAPAWPATSPRAGEMVVELDRPVRPARGRGEVRRDRRRTRRPRRTGPHPRWPRPRPGRNGPRCRCC